MMKDLQLIVRPSLIHVGRTVVCRTGHRFPGVRFVRPGAPFRGLRTSGCSGAILGYAGLTAAAAVLEGLLRVIAWPDKSRIELGCLVAPCTECSERAVERR